MNRHAHLRTTRLAVAVTAAMVTVLASASAAAAGQPPDRAPVAAPKPVDRAQLAKILARDLKITPAQAEERLRTQPDRAALAEQVRRRLGDRTGGVYLDGRTGEVVATVTSAAAAAEARAAGAVPRRVARSAATLDGIVRALNKVKAPDGASWSVDPASNTVTVTVPAARRNDARAKSFTAAARRYGPAVRIRTADTSAELAALLTGGQIITNGSYNCSAGFVAVNPAINATYTLTAGHCTMHGGTWYDADEAAAIGPVAASNFPGTDFGAVSVSNPAASNSQGWVQVYTPNGPAYEDIVAPGDPYVGLALCKGGYRTGTTCGSVTALNVSIVASGYTITGLTQTNLCARPGDSGGAVHVGGVGFGLVSAVNIPAAYPTTCAPAGTDVMWFQPITPVLAGYGLALV